MTQPESSRPRDPQSSLQDPNDFILYFDDREITPDLSDEEVMELLNTPLGPGLNDLQVAELLNSLVAATEMQTGAMVALRPSVGDLTQLAAYADEPMNELHCTLLFLGQAQLIDEMTQDAIIGCAAEFANVKPITALGSSIAIFNLKGDDPCIVMLISGSNELIQLRDTIFKKVTGLMGDRLPSQFVPYAPHVTLMYTGDASLVSQLTQLTGPITFDAIRVAFGNEITDIEFEGGEDD